MGRAVVVVVIVDCYEFQPDRVVHFYFAPAVCYAGRRQSFPRYLPSGSHLEN